MQHLQTLDYVALGAYMLLMGGIGVFLARFISGVSDYLSGGNAIPWAAAGISNYMGLFSTFVFVAYAGIAYEDGLVAVGLFWCTVPASLIAACFFAKRWRRAGIMTPVEFLETRYGPATRQVLSWGGLGFRLLENMVRLYALGVFLAAATPLDLRMSVISAGLIILTYTVVGGVWAVVVTDIVQFLVLSLITLMLVPLSLHAVGGLGSLMEAVPDHFSFFNGPRGNFYFLLAYYLMIIVKYNGGWAFIQRFYSLRDETAARNAGLLMAGLFCVFPLVFAVPALAARILAPQLSNPEMAYVAVSTAVLPPGLMGLMLAAMFAATMSALDSDFNVMAAVITRDIYRRLLRPDAGEKQQVTVARIATCGIALLVTVGALFVERLGGAFDATMLIAGVFAIPLALPLVVGVAWRRPRPWGAIASVMAGVLCGVVLNGHPEISWASATLTVIGVCGALLAFSGLIPSRDLRYRHRVQVFFEKLATPIAEADKPSTSAGSYRALLNLFAAILTVVGGLFVVVSLASIREPSGRGACAIGVACCGVSSVLYRHNRRRNVQALRSD
jgi:SSS family transporter